MNHPKVTAAFELATKWHSGQFREGSGLPYMVHPASVATLLCQWGVTNPEIMIVAFCHDLRDHKLRSRAKAEYLDSFKDKSILSLVVKLADRCQNFHDFLYTKPEYAFKYLKKADVLFKTFDARYKEVVAEFGPETAQKIMSGLDDVIYMDNEDDENNIPY